MAAIRPFETLEEAIADCGLVVGTSARQRHLPWDLVEPRECAARIAQELVERHTRFWASIDSMVLIGEDPNVDNYPPEWQIYMPERLRGAAVLDLFGGHGFPDISDDGTVRLTMGSRDFFWLGLEPTADDTPAPRAKEDS